MSDKRNRRGHGKEMKRPIILAKKEDKSNTDESGSRTLHDKPKILQKPKENATATPAPAQISIATRPVDATGEQKSHSHRTGTESASKEIKEVVIPYSSHEQFSNGSKFVTNQSISLMKKPMPVVSDHYQVVNPTLDYLVETNTDFLVVGVIGTLGSGKSTIMNILCESDNIGPNNDLSKEQLWLGQSEVFKTRSAKEYVFSNMPATEGIQMYIKPDRTILLDCSPVLCNPYKKDCILNEIDDLKMVIFMLSVCHVLIVVDEEGFNVSLLRLLQCAEKMKLDLYDKDYVPSYSPHILFFKNFCSNKNFLPSAKDRTNLLYKEFFKESKLRVSSYYYPDSLGRSGERKPNTTVNLFYFPFIDKKNRNAYTGHPDVDILIADLKQRIFMTSRPAFSSGQNLQQPTAFTEKNWSHLILSVWESHKNNYFLRKYETFKEKEWATRNPLC